MNKDIYLYLYIGIIKISSIKLINAYYYYYYYYSKNLSTTLIDYFLYMIIILYYYWLFLRITIHVNNMNAHSNFNYRQNLFIAHKTPIPY